ncbi:MAG: uracil-DNA glycosylase, partial [Myxococcota bacterium]
MTDALFPSPPASTVEVREVVSAARALLRYQGDLGLRGLELPEDLLSPSVARPGAQAPAGVAPEAPTRATEGSEPAPGARPDNAAVALQQIRDQIGNCTRCKLAHRRTNIVFGVGDPRARLMFVGEGPGRDEDLQGEPFVGAAGKLLDRMIRAMGVERGQVYIANIVKCRPPRNRAPEPDEVDACEPFLVHQIRAIRPDVIVALGRNAAQTLLRDPTPITRLRGRWREYESIPLMSTY